MTRTLRRDIEVIFNAALEPVRAGDAVRAHLAIADDGHVIVGGQQIEIGEVGVYAIAIGKASVTMVDAAAERIGERFTAGLAVSKAESPSQNPKVSALLGSHPVPDGRSLAAGEAVLRFAHEVPDGAVVMCLISGGGSSLVEDLCDGVDLDRLRELTSGLLRAGASIHELNAVRSRLSRIKAGGLMRALSHARVYNLIVSDVLGDDLQTIASGPTVPPLDSDAEAVMRRFGMPGTLPSLREQRALPMPPTTVVANLSIALDSAAKMAVELGYEPIVLTRSLDGEAREVGRLLASIVADGATGKASFGRRSCVLAGGETTVTVRGDGAGGRNTEAALAAAMRLSGVGDVALGFLATDGDDGTTGAAGAIVDGSTVAAVERGDALDALQRNDSYRFLRTREAILKTGPTGTNVNDLAIGLIG